MDSSEEERLLSYYNELESDDSIDRSSSEASDPYEDDGEYNGDPTYKPSSDSSESDLSTIEQEPNTALNEDDNTGWYWCD